jgi:hypothetical protein
VARIGQGRCLQGFGSFSFEITWFLSPYYTTEFIGAKATTLPNPYRQIYTNQVQAIYIRE